MTADGKKEHPWINFKEKREVKSNCVSDVTVKLQQKGYMDTQLCLLWIKKTFPIETNTARRLLVWVYCHVHLTDRASKELAKRKVDIAGIPGGLTPLLQPLDVCLNKPFEDRV